jgi:uroporphyrin-III C-methyltransferase/precorrin-2 dehydrogenase/sirohydrochlorin ferrochelatase
VDYFPLFVRMADRTVVIAGGGEQAAQKLRLIGRTCARIVIMAPQLDAELTKAVREGRASHAPYVLDSGTLAGAQVAFIATGCPGADAAVAALAQAAGALVNVVDRPAMCEAITPAIVDRDPLVVAIGTEGAAPVLARRVKTALEAMLPPDLGGLTAWAACLRPRVAQRVAPSGRRAFWAWFWSGPVERLWRADDRRGAQAAVEAALSEGLPPTGDAVAVIAAPAAPDLMTLRAVQRLQEADLVLHDAAVDPRVLELARRDAERVALAPADGPRAAAEAARDGGRVVRLLTANAMASDGPATVAALRAAGLEVEIVPGVTAAYADPTVATAGGPARDGQHPAAAVGIGS